MSEGGLLTRNIVLQGDLDSSAPLSGAHMIIRRADEVSISGVEFTKMGQRNILGRYPVHFHLVGGPPGSWTGLVQHCSVHHTAQRGYVVHETHNLHLLDNVGYKTVGHTFFPEDGGERENNFERNLPSSRSDSMQVTLVDVECVNMSVWSLCTQNVY